jgi:transposase
MIHQLTDEGHSISEIARRLNMDRKTVRKHLQRGLEPPVYKARPVVISVLEPFKPYLQQKLSAYPGLSAIRLLREINDLGY